jgi:two-component system sensor histidine kinase QseC
VKRLDSLRWRLAASMLLVFALGLGAAILARPFEDRGGLLGRLDVDFIREPYQDVLVLLLFTALATAIIVLVSAWSLRPLEQASTEAAGVGPRNPDARITTTRLPMEVRPMVGAVNLALDRMAQAFEAERRFVADAAHELRTPLTVLSLRLQQARLRPTPDWTEIDQDVMHMSRVVTQLLTLARQDAAGLAGERPMEVIDLCRSVREAAALVLPLVEAAERDIAIELPDHLPVRGRADDLRDVFRNLLENALVHGRGTIRVTGLRQDATRPPQALIAVADEGTGVPAAQRERLFERFRKASPQSFGSGLGLAIVREIVRVHGGSAAFGAGPETAIQIALPVVPAGEAEARLPAT